MDKKQQIQEKEYEYPYHYIPKFEGNNFSQTQYWSWGFRYLGGIHVVCDQLETLNFDSLIDVGCGDGRFLREVRDRYEDADLVGVDYSKKAIDIAQAMNPHIRYENINILEKTFERTFDIATAIEVIEHIPPDDLPGFIKGISDLLNEKGFFILTAPHQNKPVLDKHYQHFSSKKLKYLLSPHFNKIEFIPFDHRSRVLVLLSKILGGKGENFLITNNNINNWFFSIYKRRFLYTGNENHCLRIAAVCSK